MLESTHEAEIPLDETEEVIWHPNTPACEKCNTAFSRLYLWPHHCRLCGFCVCYSCSSNQLPHPQTKAMVRVCNDCFKLYNEEKKISDSQEEPSPDNESTILQFLNWVLQISLDGLPVPYFGESIEERVKRYQTLYLHEVEKAIDDAIEKNHGWTRAILVALIGSIPFAGIPPSLVYPLWRQLRDIAFIAAMHGHDVRSEETKKEIILVLLCESSLLVTSQVSKIITAGIMAGKLEPEIAKRIAARKLAVQIVTKSGEAGAVGFTALGGLFGGTIASEVIVRTGADKLVGTAVEESAKYATQLQPVTTVLQAAAPMSRFTYFSLITAGLLVTFPLVLFINKITDNSHQILKEARFRFGPWELLALDESFVSEIQQQSQCYVNDDECDKTE